MDHLKGLRRLGACDDAMNWVADCGHSGPAEGCAQQLWDACPRADWMLWLLGRLAGPPESDARRKLVGCAADCAETAVQFTRREETRAATVECIRVCRAWANGEAMIAELRQARAAAYAADAAAAYAYAAAAYAAAVAYSDAAAYASDAAYAAAAAAAWRTARFKALKAMADIVRRHYPVAPSLEVR